MHSISDAKNSHLARAVEPTHPLFSQPDTPAWWQQIPGTVSPWGGWEWPEHSAASEHLNSPLQTASLIVKYNGFVCEASWNNTQCLVPMYSLNFLSDLLPICSDFPFLLRLALMAPISLASGFNIVMAIH